MEELYKKLLTLTSLLKTIKDNKIKFTVPSLKPISAPSIKMPKANKETKLSGIAPDAKKDPKKIAQQIKDGSMSTKTQKMMLKFDKNGQWTLENKTT